MFEVDKETNIIVNSCLYSLNFSNLANDSLQEPKWRVLFDYKSEYNLADLTKKSFEDLVMNWEKGKKLELLEKYAQNFNSKIDGPLDSIKSAVKKKYYICQAKTFSSDEYRKCMGIYYWILPFSGPEPKGEFPSIVYWLWKVFDGKWHEIPKKTNSI